MKHKILTWSRRYQAALRTHLDADDREGLEAVRALGSEILAAGVPMLELAKLHEKFLVSELLPDYPVGKRAALIERAGKFFAAAVVPTGTTLRPGSEDSSPLEQTVEMLSRRTVDLAASNLALSAEITRRKSVEQALKEKERGYARLLKESAVLHEQLRNLSRQILSAQEDERKEISRELHDMVAQTLTGINIHLAALQAGATLDGKSLARNISETQLLVEHSVDLVHRFARDLRPAVLDDLGLIPALQSFMKSFTERTGVRTHLTAFAGVELLNMPRRTALFRVAQEALTNVGRHAQRQPGGGEYSETTRRCLHEDRGRWQVVPGPARAAGTGWQAARAARHEGAPGNGRRPVRGGVGPGERHDRRSVRSRRQRGCWQPEEALRIPHEIL